MTSGSSWLSCSHSLPNDAEKENITVRLWVSKQWSLLQPQGDDNSGNRTDARGRNAFLRTSTADYFSIYLLLVFKVKGTGTWRSDCGAQHRVGLEGSHTVYREGSFQLQKVAWEDCAWIRCFLLRRGPAQPTRVGTRASDRTTGLWAGTQTWDRAGEVALWSLSPMFRMIPGGFSPVLGSTLITLISMCHLFSAGNTAFTDVNIIMSGDHTYLRRWWKPDVFTKSWNNKKVKIILKTRKGGQSILASWGTSPDKCQADPPYTTQLPNPVRPGYLQRKKEVRFIFKLKVSKLFF